MNLKRRYVAATLAVTLSLAGIVIAQQPAVPAQKTPPPPAVVQPQPGTPAPAQKAPGAPATGGVQTLPAPSAKDSVKPDDVVLTIGNEKITRARFEEIKRGLPPQYSGAAGQMGERAFAGNYSQFRGMAMLAEREKLDQTPEFQEQLKFLRMELLARLAINHMQVQSQSVADDEIKAFYEKNKDQYQQAKVRGIYVALNPPARPAAAPTPAAGSSPAPQPEAPKQRTDAEAKARAEELRKKLQGGADFAALAKEASDHRDSAEKGGDLGNIRKGQLPPSLDKAVFALKPKEVSEPVKEGQGYYVFVVDELRTVGMDEAAATIRNTLQQQKFEASIKGIQTQFPVVYNDQYFGPAQPPRPVITGVQPGQPGAAKP